MKIHDLRPKSSTLSKPYTERGKTLNMKLHPQPETQGGGRLLVGSSLRGLPAAAPADLACL